MYKVKCLRKRSMMMQRRLAEKREKGIRRDVFLSPAEPSEIYFRVSRDKWLDCVQNFNSAFGWNTSHDRKDTKLTSCTKKKTIV